MPLGTSESTRQTLKIKKRRKPKPRRPCPSRTLDSALAGLEARVGLVDDVDAALAAHDAAVLVAGLHGLERMADLHGSSQQKAPAEPGEFRMRPENRDLDRS